MLATERGIHSMLLRLLRLIGRKQHYLRAESFVGANNRERDTMLVSQYPS
jgi:hypothetical protein